MGLLLFMVHDGDDDDNDTDFYYYLHGIRRNYALQSEEDGLEGPSSGLLPVYSALPIPAISALRN